MQWNTKWFFPTDSAIESVPAKPEGSFIEKRNELRLVSRQHVFRKKKERKKETVVIVTPAFSGQHFTQVWYISCLIYKRSLSQALQQSTHEISSCHSCMKMTPHSHFIEHKFNVG